MALLLPIAQGRQLMTSRDDMDTEDRLVIDSRTTPPTPVISEADKRSPQPQPMSGSLDALLQKYGAGCAVDGERGTGAVPLSMDLQLLQQCVEKSLTAAQKAPSLASLGATHELRNPALAFHRLPLMSVSTSDVTSVPPTDGQKTFSCQICSSFTAANYSDFQRHVTTHLEQGTTEDSQSSADTSVQMGLQEEHSENLVSASPPAPSASHSRSSSTKVFRCRQCSFVAPTKTDYWIHGRIHMRQDRMLQCPRCPFITEYKHHLEYHLRNHLGSKPFKCSTCNYACVNKSMLNSHMKSHTNVYQYRCADCSYASKYCHSLKVHLEKTSHRPASILNPDGSLPAADAVVMVTGTSDNLSSQMPIRRRKNGASATPISYANMPLAVGQPPAAFAMAGQSGAWSSRQSSGDAPPPLVPIANLAATVGTPGVRGELACSYCPFTTSHYVLLQQHLAVSHLGPVAMRPFPYGVAPSQDSSAMRAYPQPHLLTGDFNRAIVPGTGTFVSEHSSSPDLSPRKRSYSFIEARSTASDQQYEPAAYGDIQGYDEDRRRSYSFAVNRPSLARPTAYSEQRWPSVHELKHSSEMAPLVLEKAGDSYSPVRSSADSENTLLPGHTATATTGELPLDLSGATTGKMSPELTEENEAVKAYKDSHLEEYMDVANSHLPPRKRCRKGKAYKLDMTSVADEVNDLNKVSPSVVTTPPTITSGDLHLVPSSPTADDLDLRGVNEAHHTSPMSLDKKPAILSMADTYTVVERRVSFDAESVSGGSYGSVGSPPRSLPESLDGGARTMNEGRAGQGALHECRHCDMAFGDYFMYMMHKGYHGYQDPFTCNICGERTNNKLDFFLHIARVAHA